MRHHRVNHDYQHVENVASKAVAGDKRAADELLRLSEHVVMAVVATVKDATAIERDELAQLGRIALWKAMKSYRPQAGTWLGYAKTSARRAIYRQAQAHRAQHKREIVGGSPDPRREPSASALDQLLAMETLNERARQEQARARAAVEEASAQGKHQEIAARQRHGLTLGAGEELRTIDVRPADRVRIALITSIALQRLQARPRPARPAAEGRDFFPESQTRQGAGAPEFAQAGLLDPVSPSMTRPQEKRLNSAG